MTMKVKCNISSGIRVQQGKHTRPPSPATVPPFEENDSSEQGRCNSRRTRSPSLEPVNITLEEN